MLTSPRMPPTSPNLASVETSGALTPSRKGPRPPLRRGQSIDGYSRAQLVRLVQWIESDELIRTEGELVMETMRELGFQKRGKKIVAAIQAPIRQARR